MCHLASLDEDLNLETEAHFRQIVYHMPQSSRGIELRDLSRTLLRNRASTHTDPHTLHKLTNMTMATDHWSRLPAELRVLVYNELLDFGVPGLRLALLCELSQRDKAILTKTAICA